MLSFPYFKKRYYVSGIDWIATAFNHSSIKECGVGNIFMIKLHLSSYPNIDLINDAILKLYNIIPYLNGIIKRDLLNLAPYWKIKKKNKQSLNKVSAQSAKNYEEATSIAENIINRPIKHFIEINVIEIQDTKESLVCFVFDHRLFDAKGGETVISIINKFCSNKEYELNVRTSQEPNLKDWGEKFVAGRNVNRKLLAVRDNAEHSQLKSISVKEDSGHFSFKETSFTQIETKNIYDEAESKAGYMMTLPYLLSKTMKATSLIFKENDLEKSRYIIPATIDSRTPDNVNKNFLFNNWSFFFFNADSNLIKNDDLLIQSFKNQFYNQIKEKFANDFKNVSLLMRIAPLSIMKLCMSKFMRGGLGSFSFAYLGESVFNEETFVGCNVINLTHTPRLPLLPGLGFCFNSFRGKLNFVTISRKGFLEKYNIENINMNLAEDLLK